MGDKGVDVQALRNLYKSNDSARAIFEYLASREKNRSTTTVDRLLTVLASVGSSLARGDVIDTLRTLGDAGCGVFVTGRRGKLSRFEWGQGVSMISVARAAIGETTEVESVTPEEVEEEVSDTMLDHPFRLRPDLLITLMLPMDLTKAEATRLTQFIQSLPFE
jgi:hypothetical protein